MFDIRDRPSRAKGWLQAKEAEQPDWDGVFAGYQATVDWPGAAFYRELMDFYPQAKLILTIRQPDTWYQSTSSTIYALYKALPFWVGWPVSPMRFVVQMLRLIVWDGTFQGRFDEPEWATSVYQQHNAQVQACVPPDKLLVYRVQDGWEPLCQFLERPIPNVPFPHVNARHEIQQSIRLIKILIWLIRIILFPLGLMELFFCFYSPQNRRNVQ